MTAAPDLSLLVDFKLVLARLVESHVLRELRDAARARGRRLPVQTRAWVRSGVLAAVARLTPTQLQRFVEGGSWEAAVESAVASGAWGALVESAIHHAFPSGPN